jgi:hypothetical protein
MPRHPLTYFALGWLGLLVLAANAGASIPDGFGMTVFFVALWSLGFLFFRACRRWPVFGWLALGFIAGLFGGGYHSHTTYVVEREYDDSDCVDRDSCDGDA